MACAFIYAKQQEGLEPHFVDNTPAHYSSFSDMYDNLDIVNNGGVH
jgi:hypothetical protein